MNPQHLLERLRAAAATLSAGQAITLVCAFLAVVALTIGSAYWVNTPAYGVLFSDMDPESAGAVVAKLKNEKVTYVVDDGGRSIRVPSSRIDELRLEFASQGLPASGRVGFEIFDRTAFGVTDFLEHVNYRRALEGELARTISSIAEVAGARVHIAMPQRSLFLGQDQPTKASVVLKLRNNRPLSASTVSAITGLVAASVESLRPEAVVLVDNFGRPLARTVDASDAALSGQQLERQQRIEQDMSVRVVALLEPIVGAGRVRVNVNAKINADTQEETEERWDPTPVIRSRQSVNQSGSAASVAQGIAGARANLPPDASDKPGAQTPPAPAVVSPASPNQHTAETTNYEVSKLTRHRVQPQGQIARLSVAVVLDDDRQTGGEGAAPQSKPRPAADIQKIHDLVAASVGLDTTRGDQLTVENIAFEELPVETVSEPGLWQQYGPLVLEVGRIVGVILIVALVLFGFVRPVVRGSLAGLPALTGNSAVGGARALPTVQDLERQMDAQLQATEDQQAQSRRLPVLTRRVATLTQREPENAARLLRTWLTEDQR